MWSLGRAKPGALRRFGIATYRWACVWSLATAPEVQIVAGISDGGSTLLSETKAATWAKAPAFPVQAASNDDTALSIGISGGSTVWVGTDAGHLYRLANDGQSWQASD